MNFSYFTYYLWATGATIFQVIFLSYNVSDKKKKLMLPYLSSGLIYIWAISKEYRVYDITYLNTSLSYYPYGSRPRWWRVAGTSHL